MSNFKDMAVVAKMHFQELFKESYVSHVDEQMRIIRSFLAVIDQDMNGHLEVEVSKDELRVVLFAFKKEKRPDLDGWIVEFYLGFYVLLEDEILRVVKVLKRTGRVERTINATFLTLILNSNDSYPFQEYIPISL